MASPSYEDPGGRPNWGVSCKRSGRKSLASEPQCDVWAGHAPSAHVLLHGIAPSADHVCYSGKDVQLNAVDESSLDDRKHLDSMASSSPSPCVACGGMPQPAPSFFNACSPTSPRSAVYLPSYYAPSRSFNVGPNSCPTSPPYSSQQPRYYPHPHPHPNPHGQSTTERFIPHSMMHEGEHYCNLESVYSVSRSPSRHKARSDEKLRRKRSCWRHPCCLALAITLLLLLLIGGLGFLLFPRIPQFQLKDIRPLSSSSPDTSSSSSLHAPSVLTRPFSEAAAFSLFKLAEDKKSLKFAIKYEISFELTSSNYINWHLAPVSIEGFYKTMAKRPAKQLIGLGLLPSLDIPPMTTSLHNITFDMEHHVPLSALVEPASLDRNHHHKAFAASRNASFTADAEPQMATAHHKALFNIFQLGVANGTSTFNPESTLIRQLGQDLKKDVLLTDLIQRCSSVAKSDRSLDLDLNIQCGIPILNWTGWKPSFRAHHKIPCPFTPSVLDAISTLALTQKLS